MFYEQYKRLCASIGKSPSAVAVEAGFSKSSVTFWKKKYEAGEDVDLHQDIIKKLCAYFDVTESTLRGLEQQKKSTVEDDGLSDRQRAFVESVRSMSPEDLDLLESLIAVVKKQKE